MENLIENFKQRGSNLVAATLTSRTPNKKGGFILKKPMAWNGSFLLLPAILIMIVCLASHCKKPESDNIILLTTDFDYQKYGCYVNDNTMQQDSVYVINSNEEFAQYFNCDIDPKIDFKTKTLLIAYGGTANGVSNISTELSKENNIYSLKVDIKLNDTTVAEGWCIYVLVDKINTQRVMLNIQYHKL